MDEDLKYLIVSYKSTAADLFTQSVATNAKIRQLTDLVNALNEKIVEQQEQIEKLTKAKSTRSAKVKGDTETF